MGQLYFLWALLSFAKILLGSLTTLLKLLQAMTSPIMQVMFSISESSSSISKMTVLSWRKRYKKKLIVHVRIWQTVFPDLSRQPGVVWACWPSCSRRGWTWAASGPSRPPAPASQPPAGTCSESPSRLWSWIPCWTWPWSLSRSGCSSACPAPACTTW